MDINNNKNKIVPIFKDEEIEKVINVLDKGLKLFLQSPFNKNVYKK